MTEKRFRISQGYNDKFCHDWQKNKLLNFRQTVDLLNALHEEKEELIDALNQRTEQCDKLHEENEQLKQFIQELTTKGTGKIHLANGSIYKVDAILIDFKGDD